MCARNNGVMHACYHERTRACLSTESEHSAPSAPGSGTPPSRSSASCAVAPSEVLAVTPGGLCQIISLRVRGGRGRDRRGTRESRLFFSMLQSASCKLARRCRKRCRDQTLRPIAQPSAHQEDSAILAEQCAGRGGGRRRWLPGAGPPPELLRLRFTQWIPTKRKQADGMHAGGGGGGAEVASRQQGFSS